MRGLPNKVWIKGSKERHHMVFKELKKYGGKNEYNFSFDDEKCIYYISSNSLIEEVEINSLLGECMMSSNLWTEIKPSAKNEFEVGDIVETTEDLIFMDSVNNYMSIKSGVRCVVEKTYGNIYTIVYDDCWRATVDYYVIQFMGIKKNE